MQSIQEGPTFAVFVKRTVIENNTLIAITIEANIEATQAVHDMLIQSWAPSIGRGDPGVVRPFAATPKHWKNAWFDDLRAEGGFKVSATWNLEDLPRHGNDYVTAMRRGQVLEGKAVSRPEAR